MKDTTEVFLADTYALIEILGGNQNYKDYIDDILLTKFNLIEFYYHFLRNYGEEKAEKYTKMYSKYLVFISFDTIKNGMKFRLEHKKEKLSYADCIGYALAVELGIKFLTGDQKFENKPNVEFVK